MWAPILISWAGQIGRWQREYLWRVPWTCQGELAVAQIGKSVWKALVVLVRLRHLLLQPTGD